MRNRLFKLLLVALLIPAAVFPQAKAPYQLAEGFQFDYEVVQVSTSKKNTTDTSTMHYFYTKSGDYAGMKVSGRKGNREKNFIIFTKNGDWVVIDENKKTITIINMGNMMMNMANATKGIKRDSLAGASKSKIDPGQFQSVKTGNIKSISGYTASEYKITDNQEHKISIWYAKVDFNTQLSYLFDMGKAGAGAPGMSVAGPSVANPMIQTLADPNAFMTEMKSEESVDAKAIEMHTLSIAKASSSKSTPGYQVSNYSNMSLKDMMEAESKKNPH